MFFSDHNYLFMDVDTTPPPPRKLKQINFLPMHFTEKRKRKKKKKAFF